MTTIVDISELTTNDAPFEELGISADDYVSIDSILGKKLTIIASKAYENDKGPGVFIGFEVDGDLHYIATHAVGIVNTFANQRVIDALAEGAIGGTIIKRKSTKSDRMVYAFE